MVAVESAGADPAMRRFCDEGEAATKANIESVVQHLVELGAVNRQRHTKQRLVATAAAVVSPHVHKLLRGDRGLSRAAYERWVEAALHMCVAMASGDDLIRMHDPSKSRPQSD
jgi:hypothetical protein